MENEKPRDVVISIHSVHGYDLEDTEEMDFTTDGSYLFDDGGCELSYVESEVTGLTGTVTKMSLKDNTITVNREGTITSQMTFREGKKDSFLYNTPYGTATMGIDTRRIQTDLRPDGGEIIIDYVVNMQHLVAMRNKFIVNIEEQRTQKWQT